MFVARVSEEKTIDDEDDEYVACELMQGKGEGVFACSPQAVVRPVYAGGVLGNRLVRKVVMIGMALASRMVDQVVGAVA